MEPTSDEKRIEDTITILENRLAAKLKEAESLQQSINLLLREIGKESRYKEEAVSSTLVDIRADRYYGRPLATAVQLIMEQRKEACRPHDIADELRAGGFDFKAQGWKEKDVVRALSITLAKNTKTFHRLPNGTFGLLSWYPNVKTGQGRVGKVDAEALGLNGGEEASGPTPEKEGTSNET